MATRTERLRSGVVRAKAFAFLVGCGRGAAAFVAPRAFLARYSFDTGTLTSFDVSPTHLANDSLMSSSGIIAPPVVSSLVICEGGALDILRNIAMSITAVVFLFAGVTLLTASVVIPAAAKELEKECMELSPELWAEYQGKLEPGQTIDKRPDLMQELGAKLQPLLDAKIARAQFGEGASPSNNDAASIADAEIIPKDKDNNSDS